MQGVLPTGATSPGVISCAVAGDVGRMGSRGSSAIGLRGDVGRMGCSWGSSALGLRGDVGGMGCSWGSSAIGLRGDVGGMGSWGSSVLGARGDVPTSDITVVWAVGENRGMIVSDKPHKMLCGGEVSLKVSHATSANSSAKTFGFPASKVNIAVNRC